MADLVLFPHCDLHMAIGATPTPPLTLRVVLRSRSSADPSRYDLQTVTADCQFDFLAPYEQPGFRLGTFLPTVNPSSGLVTASTPGIYLFQVRYQQATNVHHYLVGRLQVHDSILDWWFGNSTITTALDADVAHAQPSLYAAFSADSSGADLVGDITGHGYVELTSTDTNRFMVDWTTGRLRGLTETPIEGQLLSGTFLGHTRLLPVHVVDYATSRPDLVMVRSGASAGGPVTTSDAHHLVLLPEGFLNTAEDRAKFDAIVEEVADGLMTKPRHSPFDLLSDRFYVWKAYAPSRQRALTCGFQVTDEDVPGLLPRGAPIPTESAVPFYAPSIGTYTLAELIQRVGLPRWNETGLYGQLTDLWSSAAMALPDFNRAKVPVTLFEAWLKQNSVALIEARDTFLGLRLGGRPGDRLSDWDASAVTPPANDDVNDPALFPFVERLYEFFTFTASRSVLPDPRRHPPELLAGWWGDPFPGSSFIRYLAGLRSANPPMDVGPEWVANPGSNQLRRSVGLVGVICNDEFYGGANFCDGNAFAQNVDDVHLIRYTDLVAGAVRERRRHPMTDRRPQTDQILDTFVHELGHSLNLADEYESRPGDDPNLTPLTVDHQSDNVTSWRWAHLNPHVVPPVGPPPPRDRRLNPGRVKWLGLVRPRLSSALTSDAVLVAGPPAAIALRIDPDQIPGWREALSDGQTAFLQAPSATRRQLPVGPVLQDLRIITVSADGDVILELPALGPHPHFPKGSLVFVPRRRGTRPALITEEEVLERLRTSNLPLNRESDVSAVNRGPDIPVGLADFEPPCDAYRLVGVYEGARHWAGLSYRPAGMCKMRNHHGSGTSSEFCHVCKYVIVNRIDPNVHGLLDDRHYPEAKKRREVDGG